jgi:hypothetical protein
VVLEGVLSSLRVIAILVIATGLADLVGVSSSLLVLVILVFYLF